MRVKDLEPDLIHSSRRRFPGGTPVPLNESVLVHVVLDSFSLGAGLAALRSDLVELHVEERRLWLSLPAAAGGGRARRLGGGKGRLGFVSLSGLLSQVDSEVTTPT